MPHTLLRNPDAVEDAPYHGPGIDTVRFGFKTQHEAMAQNVGCDRLDILRANVIPPRQPCMRARGTVE